MARLVELPDQLFFKIGEVADIVGVKPHVLRYWESEFRQLRPMKTRGSHRIYKRRDVEVAMLIRRLLHDEGFTIPGAKKRLKELRGEVGDAANAARETDKSVSPLENAIGPAAAAAGPSAKERSPERLVPSAAPLSRSARREATLRTELLTLRGELERLLADLDRQGRPEIIPQKSATVERVVLAPVPASR
jgi:DNA-binding transcriptional MerR regulator